MATTEELKKAYGSATESGGTQQAAGNGSYQPQVDRINEAYDKALEAEKAGLTSTYDQNKADAEAQINKIPTAYQQQANTLAAEYERNRRNFNQQAVSSGINTGTGSQAQLAQQNTYQNNMGNLRTAQEDAVSTARLNIQKLTSAYNDSVAQAVANNEYKRAVDLLDEYRTAAQSEVSVAQQKAQTLAQYGDFSGYASTYGQEAADGMATVWKMQNPDLAYNTGRMTADEYKKVTGAYPAGYASPSSYGNTESKTKKLTAAQDNGYATDGDRYTASTALKNAVNIGASSTERKLALEAMYEAGNITKAQLTNLLHEI